jgi:hypothetical protein
MSIEIVFANEKGFITDMTGAENTAGGQIAELLHLHLPRYGVWQHDPRKGCAQVTFVSDDLEACKEKLA